MTAGIGSRFAIPGQAASALSSAPTRGGPFISTSPGASRHSTSRSAVIRAIASLA